MPGGVDGIIIAGFDMECIRPRCQVGLLVLMLMARLSIAPVRACLRSFQDFNPIDVVDRWPWH